MVITIAIMRAAGASEEFILKVLELEQNERVLARREQNRIAQQNYRARKHVSADVLTQRRSPTPPKELSSELFHNSSERTPSLRSGTHTWPANSFEQFWNAYPRKVGKKDAARALDKVRRADEIAFLDLIGAVGRIDRKDPQFIPYPATWLNRGSHLDGASNGGTVENGPPQWLKDKIEETRREHREREERLRAAADRSGTEGPDRQPDLLSQGQAFHCAK